MCARSVPLDIRTSFTRPTIVENGLHLNSGGAEAAHRSERRPAFTPTMLAVSLPAAPQCRVTRRPSNQQNPAKFKQKIDPLSHWKTNTTWEA